MKIKATLREAKNCESRSNTQHGTEITIYGRVGYNIGCLSMLVIIFIFPSRVFPSSESWIPVLSKPYANGTLQEEHFSNPQNQEELLVRQYDPTGRLLKEYYLKTGKMHGPARVYYPSGALKGEAHFAAGKWDGTLKSFSKDGKVLSEGEFRQGRGTEKEYYPEGGLKAETAYVTQKRHGHHREYYRDGSLKYQDTFERDYRIERKKYSENGKLEFVEPYQENWVTRALLYLALNLNETSDPDLVKKYYREGSLKQEIISRSGRREGVCRVYHRNGLLKYQDTYRTGRLLKRKAYDFEGRLLGEIDLRGGVIRDFSRLMRDKKVVTTQAGSSGKGAGSRDVSLINFDSSK